jgi:hypothetical protein
MAINTVANVRKLITLSRETVARVVAYKKTHGVPSESEAIRTLIKAGLDSAQKEDRK